jgi:hypothetical protein
VLIKLTVLVLLHDNTILQFESKEHPVIHVPFVFISCFRFSCIFSGRDKIGSSTNDTVYIKDNNSIAVSSGSGINRCIVIIDIESQKVMTTISMDTYVYGMKLVFRCSYIKNSFHITVDDITYRFISEI